MPNKKKIVYGRDLGKKTWEMGVEPADKDFHLKQRKEIWRILIVSQTEPL